MLLGLRLPRPPVPAGPQQLVNRSYYTCKLKVATAVQARTGSCCSLRPLLSFSSRSGPASNEPSPKEMGEGTRTSSNLAHILATKALCSKTCGRYATNLLLYNRRGRTEAGTLPSKRVPWSRV